MSASEKWNKLPDVPEDIKPVIRAAITYTELAHKVHAGIHSLHDCREYPCLKFNEEWKGLCRTYAANTKGFREKADAAEMAHRRQDLIQAEHELRMACRVLAHEHIDDVYV